MSIQMSLQIHTLSQVPDPAIQPSTNLVCPVTTSGLWRLTLAFANGHILAHGQNEISKDQNHASQPVPPP
jgi:hypothetical protein